MPCPKCGSENKVNSGKVKERQRHKCKQCGCNYTQSFQHGYRLYKKHMSTPVVFGGQWVTRYRAHIRGE